MFHIWTYYDICLYMNFNAGRENFLFFIKVCNKFNCSNGTVKNNRLKHMTGKEIAGYVFWNFSAVTLNVIALPLKFTLVTYICTRKEWITSSGDFESFCRKWILNSKWNNSVIARKKLDPVKGLYCEDTVEMKSFGNGFVKLPLLVNRRYAKREDITYFNLERCYILR